MIIVDLTATKDRLVLEVLPQGAKLTCAEVREHCPGWLWSVHSLFDHLRSMEHRGMVLRHTADTPTTWSLR